jgi:hypothetical protein
MTQIIGKPLVRSILKVVGIFAVIGAAMPVVWMELAYALEVIKPPIVVPPEIMCASSWPASG